eukprot:Nk52_evm3s212 gene=Nk52_evmTU3s212
MPERHLHSNNKQQSPTKKLNTSEGGGGDISKPPVGATGKGTNTIGGIGSSTSSPCSAPLQRHIPLPTHFKPRGIVGVASSSPVSHFPEAAGPSRRSGVTSSFSHSSNSSSGGGVAHSSGVGGGASSLSSSSSSHFTNIELGGSLLSGSSSKSGSVSSVCSSSSTTLGSSYNRHGHTLNSGVGGINTSGGSMGIGVGGGVGVGGGSCAKDMLKKDDGFSLPLGQLRKQPDAARSKQFRRRKNMSSQRQLWALLRKNWLLKKRRPWSTVMEVLTPIVTFLLMAWLRTVAGPPNTTAPVQSPIMNMEIKVPHSGMVAFSPMTPQTVYIMKIMENNYVDLYTTQYGEDSYDNKLVKTYFKGFETAEEMRNFILDHRSLDPEGNPSTVSPNSNSRHARFMGAIEFENIPTDSDTLPENVEYTIRYPHRLHTPYNRRLNRWHIPWIEQGVDFAIIEAKQQRYNVMLGSKSQPRLQKRDIREGPASDVYDRILYYLGEKPEYKTSSDIFLVMLSSGIIISCIMSFSYILASSVKDLVAEKERRITEAMKMMGLTSGLNWIASGITIMAGMTITVSIITFIIFYYGILNFVSWTVFFVFFMLYCLSVTTFCFMISTFFDSSKKASSFITIFFLLSYLPYTLYGGSLNSTDPWILDSMCFANSACFGMGLKVMIFFEEMGIPLGWGNLAVSPRKEAFGFNLLYCMFMLVLDSSLYFLIAYYVNEVFPGQFGIPRPKLFFLQKSFWNQQYEVVPLELDAHRLGEKDSHNVPSAKIETEPTSLYAGVRIKNMSKVYDNGKVAVKNFSLNMYEGQITSLLGHNGAGKTTIMSMLAGLFPPSSGNAIVSDHSIIHNMPAVRESLGLCPQFDVLFPQLTVWEHLWFFSELKGVPLHQSMESSMKLIEILGLKEKVHCQVRTLSGGQRRKLSVAIAFVGGSKIVILDEPTSGMDPYSRRATWDLLLKFKQDRTIILSTHYMDEADLLGDRIAIIANGRLRCVGSSLFLKSHYGVGYHLTFVKKDAYSSQNGEIVAADDDDRLEKNVSNFLSQYLPSFDVSANLGSELSYTVASQHSQYFEKLFTELEPKLDSLGLSSYGISVTTLEEVFLAVGNEVDKESLVAGTGPVKSSANALGGNVARKQNDGLNALRQRRTVRYNTGFRRLKQQLSAMFRKRVINAMRDRKMWIYQTFIPLLFAYFTLQYGAPQSEPSNISDKISRAEYLATDNRRFTMPKMPISGDVLSVVKDGSIAVPIYSQSVHNPFENVVRDALFDELSSNYYEGMFQPEFTGNLTEYFHQCHLNRTTTLAGFTIFDTAENEYLPDREKFKLGYFQKSFISNRDPNTIGVSIIFNQKDELKWLREVLIKIMNNAVSRASLGARHRTTSHLSEYEYRETKNHQERVKKQKSETVISVDGSKPAAGKNRQRRGDFGEVDIQGLLKEMDTTLKDLEKELTTSYEDIHSGAMPALNEYLCGTLLVTSLAYIVNAFSVFVVREKGTNSKQLQLISTHPMTFWMANLIWDFLNFALTASGMFYMVYQNQMPAYSDNQFLPFILLVLAYGICNISMVHMLSVPFDNPVTAQNVILNFNLLTVSIPIVIELVVELLAVPGTGFAAHIGLWVYVVRYGFLLLPNFVLCRGFINLIKNAHKLPEMDIPEMKELGEAVPDHIKEFLGAFLAKNEPDAPPVEVDWFRVSKDLLNLLGVGAFYFSLIVLAELGYFRKIQRFLFGKPGGRGLWSRLWNRQPRVAESLPSLYSALPQQESIYMNEEDEDVARERHRIDACDPEMVKRHRSRDIILVKDLTKVYSTSWRSSIKRLLPAKWRAVDKTAVDGVSLGIPNGECFGLLGHNGAGKTTTFKMLTGDCYPTGGEAFLNGCSVVTELLSARKSIGYCPQENAFIEMLTGRETIELYASVRGIAEEDIPGETDRLINALGLTEYQDMQCEKYSGGNKRKLATAISLVGDPNILFLDEPTTGMDPKSRRVLWNALLCAMHEGRCIVLTSHSMEECEALCTRLAIMVDGAFKCLGSPQHLKNRFGSGYVLVIKLKPPSTLPHQHHGKSMDGTLSSVMVGLDDAEEGLQQCPVVDLTAIIEDVQRRIPSAQLLETHETMLRYSIPQQSATLSFIFGQIEAIKKVYHIEDYSLSQTTLEQVFVNFVRGSEENTMDMKSVNVGF